MKVLVVIITLQVFFGAVTYAGDSAHGSDPMKDRFIIARARAIKILRSQALVKYFNANERSRMIKKLTLADPLADPKTCFEGKLCWYNTEPLNPQPPLRAELYGQAIDPILSTTPEENSIILIDINRAKNLGLSDELAVVSICHEAGHTIGRSDNLEVDKIIIKYLETHFTRATTLRASTPKIKSPDTNRYVCSANCIVSFVYVPTHEQSILDEKDGVRTTGSNALEAYDELRTACWNWGLSLKASGKYNWLKSDLMFRVARNFRWDNGRKIESFDPFYFDSQSLDDIQQVCFSKDERL